MKIIENPYRLYKNEDSDLKDTEYLVCSELQPVGRIIAYLLKHFKKIDTQKIKAFYILNPENLVFSGRLEQKYQKYHEFYKAGSWTKGPFIERSPKGLFKYLLRRNLLYKKRDKHLFKKICVFSNISQESFKNRNSVKLDTSIVKPKLYCKVVTLPELFHRL